MAVPWTVPRTEYSAKVCEVQTVTAPFSFLWIQYGPSPQYPLGLNWFVLWTWLSWEWKHLWACLSEYLQTCDFIGTRPPWTRAVAQSGLRLLRLTKKKTESRTPASSVLLPTLDTCHQLPPTPGALHSHSRSWRTFKRQVKTHSSLACACQVSQHSDRKRNQYASSGRWVHEALWGRQRVFGVYDNPAPPALFNCGLEAALKLTSTGYVVCIKDQEHSLGRPLQLWEAQQEEKPEDHPTFGVIRLSFISAVFGLCTIVDVLIMELI